MVKLIEPAAFTKVSALGVAEQRVNVVGRFGDYPGRLGDRYRVEVSIVIWQAPDVLMIPSSALFRRDGRWHVFAIENGRARLRPITTGHHGGAEVEVVDGLAQGAIVIRHPSDRLADNALVELRK
ncbi:MAG: hypothetical protein ABI647_19150 [Gemmatimonadota bacterium]